MNSEMLEPINGRILLEVHEIDSTYQGNLLLAETAPDKLKIGIVKALPIGYTGTAGLEVGTKVLFNRHSGSVLKFDRFDPKALEYRLVKEEDLFAKLRDNQ
jgi:co-chaperonin GroES (HSP10)